MEALEENPGCDLEKRFQDWAERQLAKDGPGGATENGWLAIPL